ncbi:DUF1641 domain-containing protein [Pseudobacillus wudalianchiensis]|uniref:DUF1641 domain-containing protein n=1 Tax=Pseudobacillus wudalianchiensis TaxID=1743143 RepID=A0A1B9ATJ7_9BACI|nr:DUF1641 domain-containing protein [Bacillus wudalianchiensis]OCA87216.1 hypothetical protein A8F95_08135 [Bacillus wudalianchiensis]
MAAPITSIRKHEYIGEEQAQQKLTDLQKQLAEHEEALNSILTIVGELNDMGALEAANSMLQAKEKVASIAIHQASREPITNLINHFLSATDALANMDPNMMKKLTGSITAGVEEANEHLHSGKPLGMIDLLKVLKDPDINRAVRFGVHFLKGMGKELKKE